MLPILFKIGTFEVRSFGLMLMVAMIVGMVIAQRRARANGVDPNKLLDLTIYLVVFGVLGARLLFILQELPYYLDPKNQGELISLRFDGLTSFGAILAALIVLPIWARKNRVSLLATMDTLGVPFLVGHAIGRVGCLLNGCCFGGETSGPLGVRFVDVAGLRHPAQIYDSSMTLAGVGLILLAERRGLLQGQSVALALMAYGTSRFIYEFWRAGASSTYWGSLPITQAQAMALAFVLVGAGLFLIYGRRRGAPSVSVA